VSGADPIDTRPGFAAMLERIEGKGVRTIIVETAPRKLVTPSCANEASLPSMRCSGEKIAPDADDAAGKGQGIQEQKKRQHEFPR
jgi:hypothetical protein